MKIQRFNESVFISDDDEIMKKSPKLSKKVNNFIKEVNSCVDNTIFDWISYISSQTKLTEYQKCMTSESDTTILRFANEKGLDRLKDYTIADQQIYEKDKEIRQIKENQKIIYTEASSQLIYKFQEELLEKDFDNFYKFFIEESRRREGEEITEDIHPDLWNKYKDEIKLKIQAKQYNL